jgi:hypothetical protein
MTAPALLGRLDAGCIEPLRQGGDGLVGCEVPFPVADQRRCDALEIVAHSNPHCSDMSPEPSGPPVGGDLGFYRSKRRTRRPIPRFNLSLLYRLLDAEGWQQQQS